LHDLLKLLKKGIKQGGPAAASIHGAALGRELDRPVDQHQRTERKEESSRSASL
jgi:hypothetical protein